MNGLMTVPREAEIQEPAAMKFYLFYRWHGMSMREFQAKSMKEAEEYANKYLNLVDPVDWAYLVVADVGKLLRGGENERT
uniref:Uncharacterized protein n=1 Tax=viral metagenome TaxID=1070528 RepID=A0A6M3X579_9ZZZZ